MNWAKVKLKLFGNWPVIGKQIQVQHYTSLMDEVDLLEKQFNKARVRFEVIIRDLYDCLERSPVTLNEDFNWFLSISITSYTNTSTAAHYLLDRILKGEFFKYDLYIKELNVSSRETDFLDWYSSNYTVQMFMENFHYLMGLYCLENPLDEEHGDHTYKETNRLEINRSTLDFLNSSHFRLVLDDYLTMVRMSIDSQLRRLNGEAN